MGAFKRYLMEQEEMAEPCASDFETKRSYNAKPKKLKKKANKRKQQIRNTPGRTNSDKSVPMSINSPFDNAEAWLDDEPWRKW